MKSNLRNGKIDLYKFIFSIVVVLYHFSNASDYDYFNSGYIAVEFFFIVSGFLFAKSLSKYVYNKETVWKDSLRFMKKKYVNFLPYHFFICIATVVFSIINYHWNFQESIFRIINSLPNIFLVQMFGIHNMDLLGHEWYLSAMLISMFILTPVIIRFRKAYSYYIAPVIVFVIIGILNNNFGNLNIVTVWNGLTYSGLLRAFMEISLGCICYAIYESGFIEKFNRTILLCIETLTYVIILLYTNTTTCDRHIEFSLLFILAVGVTISFSDKTSLKFLNNRFVLFLGKLSFPLYLNQIWIRQIIKKFYWPYGDNTYAFIYVAAVIVASLVCMFVTDNIIKFIQKYRIKK